MQKPRPWKSIGQANDLTVDSEWLASPERQFPILLDPTITIQPPAEDAYFISTCPNCVAQAGERLLVGSDRKNFYRAALRFDFAAIPAGAVVTGATLSLFHDGTCIYGTDPWCPGRDVTGNWIAANRMTKQWSSSSRTADLAYDTVELASPIPNPGQWTKWDVTTAVRDWASAVQPNYGLLLKRKREDQSQNANGPAYPGSRYNIESTIRPKLEITYSGDNVQLLPPATLHSDGAELRWTPYTGSAPARRVTGASAEAWDERGTHPSALWEGSGLPQRAARGPRAGRPGA